jgi:hypothetical protein
MELVEAKAYLDLSNWDLEEAIRSAKEDDGWNIRADAGACDEGMCDEVCNGMIEAVARPKALTANDIYAVSDVCIKENLFATLSCISYALCCCRFLILLSRRLLLLMVMGLNSKTSAVKGFGSVQL